MTPKLHTGAGHADETEVILDAKIACSQLPPPPFKGLVKSAPLPCCMSLRLACKGLEGRHCCEQLQPA